MALNVIYNGQPNEDLVTLLTYINDFTKGLGEKNVVVDPEKCYGILRGIQTDFPNDGGMEMANAFKKVAHFMCYFVAEQPISSSFSDNNVGGLAQHGNHQNAIVALQVAIDSLHGATVRDNTDDERILTNKIMLSKHSYMDIIEAVRNITPANHFKLMTVFLEQMAYKANPDCQYPLVL